MARTSSSRAPEALSPSPHVTPMPLPPPPPPKLLSLPQLTPPLLPLPLLAAAAGSAAVIATSATPNASFATGSFGFSGSFGRATTQAGLDFLALTSSSVPLSTDSSSYPSGTVRLYHQCGGKG